MKRYAIFSDIHGNYEALEAIIDDLQKTKYDDIFYLGDAISIGPDSKKCLDLLKNNNIKFILGNHELYYLYGYNIDSNKSHPEINHLNRVKDTLDENDHIFLSKCPLYYKINDNKILLSHFLISDENKLYPFEDNNLKNDPNQWIKHNNEFQEIIISHEHESINEDCCKGVNEDFEKTMKVSSNIWIVGSAGCTKDNKTTYTVVEIDVGVSITRHTITYNREKFLNRLDELDYPNKENIKKYFYGLK